MTEKTVVILHPLTCEPVTVFVSCDGFMRNVRFADGGHPARMHRNVLNAHIRTAKAWITKSQARGVVSPQTI